MYVRSVNGPRPVPACHMASRPKTSHLSPAAEDSQSLLTGAARHALGTASSWKRRWKGRQQHGLLPGADYHARLSLKTLDAAHRRCSLGS